MYAERYQPRRVNRGSLTLSVAIVGSLLAAAMMSRYTIAPPGKDPILHVYPVHEPPPPPEEQPKPRPRTAAKPTPRVDQPVQRVPTEPKVVWNPPPEQPPVFDPGTGEGAGAGPAIEPVKPPPPVVTDTAIDPRYARDFQPLYPPAEQRAGRDGMVTLKVLVGVDGRVVRAEQVLATSDEFWRVTQKQALAKWRFKPATRDGVPFEAWRTMTVRFRLEDQ